MKFKGLIMDVSDHTVTVLTKNKEFYKLKRKSTMYKSQEIEFKKSDIINLVYYVKRLSVVAACFVLILTGAVYSGVIPAFNVNNSEAFGYISLDVNPSIGFEIDEEQKISGIFYLEDLADDIEEELSLEGMEISDGLLKVVEYYKKASILSDSKENYVLLAGVVNDKNKIVRKNKAEAEKKMTDNLKSYRSRIENGFQKMNMIVIESGTEHMKLSKKNNISMGKYTIFTEISQVKNDISIEEFRELSLKDIIEEYMSLPKNNSDSEDEVESTPDMTDAAESMPTPTPNSAVEPTEEVTPTIAATPEATPAETPVKSPVATSAAVTHSATAMPTATPAPTPTPSAKPQYTPAATPTVRPVKTPVPEETQTPSPTPKATPTIRPSSTPVLHETQRPRPTPGSMPTARPSSTPVFGETQNPMQTPGTNPTATPNPDDIGTGLRGEYYNNPDFTDLAATRIDGEINFSWGRNLPHPDLNDDGSISIRWEGQIKAENTEMYTFYINRGYGVRLWINDIMVISEWTKDLWGMSSFGHIFLTGGQKYNIKLEYYEFNNFGNYGDIKLEWSSMSTPIEVIPQSVLFPSEKPLSSTEEFPSGVNGFESDSTDSEINFNWPYISMFNGEVLSERRTGKIEPPYSEEYTFYITNNNSARLWINNELVISGWNELWNLTNTGIIYLEAGKKYDICLEYYKNMGTGEIILEWSSQSMPRNVVPQDRFHIE